MNSKIQRRNDLVKLTQQVVTFRIHVEQKEDENLTLEHIAVYKRKGGSK